MLNRTWKQEPRLYDDVNGNNWWPWPARLGAEYGTIDLSQADRLMGAVFGRCSDDRVLFVSMQVPVDASDKEKAWATEQATKKINTFLDENCKCEKGHVCDWHSTQYGAVVEEGGQMPLC